MIPPLFLNFAVKESPDKVSIGTVEKLTSENMGIAFGILAVGSTEPEIHLGGHLSPPPITMYVLKNIIATLGFSNSKFVVYIDLMVMVCRKIEFVTHHHIMTTFIRQKCQTTLKA